MWYLIFLSGHAYWPKDRGFISALWTYIIWVAQLLILFGTTLKPLFWLFSSIVPLRLFLILISGHISTTELLAQNLILSPSLNFSNLNVFSNILGSVLSDPHSYLPFCSGFLSARCETVSSCSCVFLGRVPAFPQRLAVITYNQALSSHKLSRIGKKN